MNVLHNSVDSTLLRIINKRTATEKEIIANDKQSDKSGLAVLTFLHISFRSLNFNTLKNYIKSYPKQNLKKRCYQLN